MEAKLEQQFRGIVHDLLFQVFLDVRRSYNSLDKGDAWKYYVSMAWDLDYSNYYSSIDTYGGWFQNQGSNRGDPPAQGEE